MRPDESELDEEIRGHLAINIKERIDRGEDPVSARRSALMEFGYVPAIRDEMRRVWYSRWYDACEAFARDTRFALRSLVRRQPGPGSADLYPSNRPGYRDRESHFFGPGGERHNHRDSPRPWREFGIRLAVGSTPRDLRTSVLWDGVRIAAIGIAAGAAGGYVLVRVAEGVFGNVHLPGALPVIGAAIVLIGAAVVASLMPARRASRIDVLQALRSE